MDGFLNVNKPAGITSYDVIRKLNRVNSKVKMGHLGTLDPMAKGVLPIAVGNATRLIEYIDNRTKTYVTRMVLGGISDTQDSTGHITWIQSEMAEPQQIIEAAKTFTGIIFQIPPMYSAVHHQGKRLYELARQGVTVEVKARQVEIEAIDITAIACTETGLPQVSLQVKCSEGTYIRTLCHDIGQKLGTGAYMDDLIRINSGVFSIDESYSLEAILANGLEACLKPLDYPINGLTSVILNEEDYARVYHGNTIEGFWECPAGVVRLYYQDRLVAIARCCREEKILLKPMKVFNQ